MFLTASKIPEHPHFKFLLRKSLICTRKYFFFIAFTLLCIGSLSFDRTPIICYNLILLRKKILLLLFNIYLSIIKFTSQIVMPKLYQQYLYSSTSFFQTSSVSHFNQLPIDPSFQHCCPNIHESECTFFKCYKLFSYSDPAAG